MPFGNERRIKRRKATQEADSTATVARRRIQRLIDCADCASHQRQARHVTLRRGFENRRGETAEVARAGIMGKGHQTDRFVAEALHCGLDQRRVPAYAIMNQKAFLQQCPADARTTAEIAQHEAPAPGVRHLAPVPRDVDRAGPEDRHDAIGIAKGALQRDQAVGVDLRGLERQACGQLADLFRNIGTRESEEGGDLIQRELEAGCAQRLFSRRDDIAERTVQIGEDIGSTAPGAPENLSGCVRDSGAAARSSSVNSDEVIRHLDLLPIQYQKNTIYQGQFVPTPHETCKTLILSEILECLCRFEGAGSTNGKFLLDNWYFNGINTPKQGEHGMPGATEARHGHAEGLDGLPSEEILSVIQDTQLKAAEAVRAAIPAISRASELAAERLRAGGRLIYVGAGSSGLMALADGLELPGTFGLAHADVKILLAGGVDSLSDLAGNYEDDETLALSDLEAAGVAEGDCVVCVTASGSTPYTLAIARAARDRRSTVIGISNNRDAALFALSDISVFLETPPEVVAGSTRMGAGTAQKIALNMLSTLMAIRLGHVHDGYMINLKADNAKLQQRARGIVSEIAGVDADSAAGCLQRASGSVKIATLLAAGVGTPEGAVRLLANCNQNFRQALEMARAGL